MRILLPHPVHALGGLEVYLLDLAAALAERGDEILVALPEGSEAARQAARRGLRAIPVPEGPDPGDGARARFALLVRAAAIRRDFVALLDRVRPEAWIAASGLTKVLAAASPGLPPRLAIEASPPRPWQLHRHGPGREYRQFLLRSGAVLAHSQGIRDAWRGAGLDTEAWEVIPSLPDFSRIRRDAGAAETPSRASLGVPADAFLLGMVARLEWEKGFREALDLLKDLVGESPPVYLAALGDGWQGEDIRSEARARGLADRIRWIGFEPNPAPWYRAFDALLFPSHREGFPLVPLEAMCLGCPVFASDVGDMRNFFVRSGEDGILFPLGDRDGLAAAVRRLRDDLPARRALGAAGARRAEAFPHATMTDRISKILRRGLAR